MLQRLEILRGPGAGVEPGLVTRRTVADELDVCLGLGHLPLDVAERRAGVDELGVVGSGLLLESGQLLQLRQGRLRVGDLVQPGVDGLQVEQPQLAGRVGFQDVPPAALAPTTKVQGSVRSVEMKVSNLVDGSCPPAPPSTRASSSSALASQTHSLAQCPASTR